MHEQGGPRESVDVRVGPSLEHGHPSPAEYVKVGVVLAIVTSIEVAVYYIDALRPILAPILLVLSATKFSAVVLWFMHLKFDSRLFSSLFVGGLFLAAAILIAMLALFNQLFTV